MTMVKSDLKGLIFSSVGRGVIVNAAVCHAGIRVRPLLVVCRIHTNKVFIPPSHVRIQYVGSFREREI